ncbi:MAG: hypothetical protein GQ533_08625 [Methanosarcinaceae archaeon]|nr:hypothetical protein [Methanosarcinaceae archaeon]
MEARQAQGTIVAHDAYQRLRGERNYSGWVFGVNTPEESAYTGPVYCKGNTDDFV